MVTMTRMSGRCWASIPASASMRVCTLRAQLEEHMVGMSKLGEGSVYYNSWQVVVSSWLCHSGKSSEAA